MIGNHSVYNDYEDYYYEYDSTVNEISVGELVVPLLVYSVTFTIGLMGNVLILVAVSGQTQVSRKGLVQSIVHPAQTSISTLFAFNYRFVRAQQMCSLLLLPRLTCFSYLSVSL